MLVPLGPAQAQTAGAGESPPFELDSSSRVLLARLQSEWLEWLTAINAGDEASADEAVARILAYGGEVSMPRLPELSIGAAARAVELARSQQPQRAAWALEASRRLDPGRPESAFAAAAVARSEGSRVRPLLDELRGLWRSRLDPLYRTLLLVGLAAWLLTVLALAALAFAAVQMAIKGGWLYRDLLALLGRYLPPLLAHPLIWLLALWPLLLPAWPIWLALYWAVLLWSYSGLFERTVFVAAFVLVIPAPVVLDEAERRLEGFIEPGPQAVEAAARGQLHGSLLTELASLRSRLPESAAVRHAVADVHRRLGQCDLARVHYAEVLQLEPGNLRALADLGLCSFESGDYGRAIDYFQSAADSGLDSAAVYFNLSQAHSELYRFSDSESALRSARRLDSDAVSSWLREAETARLVPLDGGLARAQEIRRELGRAQQDSPGPWRRILRHSWVLPVLGAFAVVGVALHLVVRGGARRPRPSRQGWFSEPADLWRRVLLPGLAEGEVGEWSRALVALVVTAGVLTIPLIDRLGFAVPWGLEPGSSLRQTLFAIALPLFVVVRFFRQRAGM